MSILTDDQFDRLKGRTMTKGKTLQGVHSYDILANPLYLDDFQYVTAAEPDRAECIIDDEDNEDNDAAQSDLVRIALNLAYLTKDKVANFKMTKASLSQVKDIKANVINWWDPDLLENQAYEKDEMNI